MDGGRKRAFLALAVAVSIALGTGVAQASESNNAHKTVRGRVRVTMTMLKGGGMTADVDIVPAHGKALRVTNSAQQAALEAHPNAEVAASGTAVGGSLSLTTFQVINDGNPRHLGAQRLAVIKLEIGRYPIKNIGGSVQSVAFRGKQSLATMVANESRGALTITGDEISDTLPAGMSRTCDANYDWADYLYGRHPGYDLYAIVTDVACGQVAGQAVIGGAFSWYYVGMYPEVLFHEVGHNLGFHHASSLDCRDATGYPVSLSSQCTSYEYGDRYDPMGEGSAGRCTYNGYDRLVAQWPESYQQVTADGDVQLRAKNLDADGLPQAITIAGAPAQYGGFFWLEWRTDDMTTCKQRKDHGLQVRIVANGAGEGNHTYLLDMSPDGGTLHRPGRDQAHYYMPVGQTFRDPLSAVSITLKSEDLKTGVAVVHVGFHTAP
jgi:hypothetical protein